MSINPVPPMPHWTNDPMAYAVQQEIDRHDQPLWELGELTMFVLMWTIFDYNAGLVGRCPVCYTAYGDIAEVYDQPAKRKCSSCYGTTFEGGYRAKIIRPSIWTDTSEDTIVKDRSGQVIQDAETVQSTSDFSMNTDDYVFRADGTRWQIRDTTTSVLHTGFEFTTFKSGGLGWVMGRTTKEDPSSVAFIIPPVTAAELATILGTSAGTRYPPDRSIYEDIRGPLKL